MKTLRFVVLALVLVALAFAVVGCGSGSGSGAQGAASDTKTTNDALVGKWVQVKQTDGSPALAENAWVFTKDDDQNHPYRLTDSHDFTYGYDAIGGSITLTRLEQQNGAWMAIKTNPSEQQYQLNGDSLVLQGVGEFARDGSDAAKGAQAQYGDVSSENKCESARNNIRNTWLLALENAAVSGAPEDFATLKSQLPAQYDISKFACPSGGTFTLVWSEKPREFTLKCSVHGDEPAR